ncbi:MAG: type II secretion system protein [Phycisphaerae bacterium]|nr:type II secretion system protein [Phycisphaerae bacterium]
MRRQARAFTMVEILIVVVILGILAAAVVPQFVGATADAQRTGTVDQLSKIRRAVDVYFVRHSNQWPPIGQAGPTDWAALTSQRYLPEAPVNNWVQGNARTHVILRDSPDTLYHSGYGWVFDPATGRVWAAGFDGSDNAFAR